MNADERKIRREMTAPGSLCKRSKASRIKTQTRDYYLTRHSGENRDAFSQSPERAASTLHCHRRVVAGKLLLCRPSLQIDGSQYSRVPALLALVLMIHHRVRGKRSAWNGA